VGTGLRLPPRVTARMPFAPPSFDPGLPRAPYPLPPGAAPRAAIPLLPQARATCAAAQYAKMVLALAAGGGGGAKSRAPAAVCETAGLEYTLFTAGCLSSQLTVGLAGAQSRGGWRPARRHGARVPQQHQPGPPASALRWAPAPCPTSRACPSLHGWPSPRRLSHTPLANPPARLPQIYGAYCLELSLKRQYLQDCGSANPPAPPWQGATAARGRARARGRPDCPDCADGPRLTLVWHAAVCLTIMCVAFLVADGMLVAGVRYNCPARATAPGQG
jgi:hypothetical protein